MMKSQSDQASEVIRYYNKTESMWGYRLLLGGTKHFGFYPPGQENLSMRTAMQLMIDEVGNRLSLPSDSMVLDAGCGEGDAALRLAARLSLRVDGVDLLDFNIAKAKAKAQHHGLEDRVHFWSGDYSELPYPDETLDGVYTLETLVHAADSTKVLKEFYRVLKPGGRLVLFEYSMPSEEALTPEQRRVFSFINDVAAMPSLGGFVHDSFPELLDGAGFECVSVENIMDRTAPMMKRLARLGVIPYQIGKRLHLEHKVINAMAAVETWRHKEVWRYNVIVGLKP